MKSLILLASAVVLGLLGLGTTSASAQQPKEPEAVVRAMFDAFNNGDIEQFSSYLSDDATATRLCGPAAPCKGKAAIAQATQAEIAEGVHADIRDLSVNGGTVVVHISEAAAGFAELGIERVYITVTFTVVDGKVTHFDDVLDLSDPQTAKFAQALGEGESAPAEPRTVPSTGTGGSSRRDNFPLVPVLLLALAGSVVLAAGVRTERRHRA